MPDPDRPGEAEVPPPPDATGGADESDQTGGTDAADATAPDAETLAAQVTRRPARAVDPEDWAAGGGDDDDRYLRERPPHW